MASIAASGWDTIDTCDPATSVIVEPARSAILRCVAKGSVRKVKSPLWRWNKACRHRPRRSTQITALTITVTSPGTTQSANTPDTKFAPHART